MFGAFPHRGAHADVGTDADSDSVSDLVDHPTQLICIWIYIC